MDPFLSLRRGARAGVVLTCEHATRRLPDGTRPTLDEARILSSHWGWDIGGWALTRELSGRLHATAVGGRWSRLYIDLNRALDDPTLIRREAEALPLSWNRRLSAAEVERRVRRFHVPYHAELERRLAGHIVRGIRPVILAVHTFTPVWNGKERGFEIGVLYREHEARAKRLMRGLRAAGLSVRSNEPYSGFEGLMYSAERHGSLHRLPCLELEVNQGLFERNGACRRLGAAIASGLARILRD